jgi:hypothetical protein
MPATASLFDGIFDSDVFILCPFSAMVKVYHLGTPSTLTGHIHAMNQSRILTTLLAEQS